MDSTGIEDLPAELRLQILSKLDSESIARFRGVSQIFRELIDEPRNQNLLLRPGEKCELDRLKRTADDLLNRKEDSSAFLQALQCFLAHRGIRANAGGSKAVIYHVMGFAVRWAYGSEQPHPAYPYYLGHRLDHHEWVTYFAEAGHVAAVAADLMQLHNMPHVPEGQSVRADGTFQDMTSFIDRHSTPVHFGTAPIDPDTGRVGGFSAEQLEEMYRTVREDSSGFFKGDVHVGDRYFESLPDYPLTELLNMPSGSFFGEEKLKIRCLRGCCTKAQLMRLFPGIPALSDGNYFAYCVKTPWAYNLIKSAVSSQGQLDRKMLLALFQELYIY